jgi:hypothetical protein
LPSSHTDGGLLARRGGGGVVHLLRVVHDPVRRVLGEHHQVHARQAALHADQHLADLAGVVQHLGLGVQAGHLVVDDRDADAVVAARNITMSHDAAPEGVVEKKQKGPGRCATGSGLCVWCVWSDGFVSSLPIVLNSPKAAHTSFRSLRGRPGGALQRGRA